MVGGVLQTGLGVRFPEENGAREYMLRVGKFGSRVRCKYWSGARDSGFFWFFDFFEGEKGET